MKRLIKVIFIMIRFCLPQLIHFLLQTLHHALTINANHNLHQKF